MYTKYQSCGPSGFREEDFFYFFPIVIKSMETINPRGVAKFDPRGMNGTIYVFSFSYCRSMETIDPQGVAKFDPGDMIGTIYVEDH